MASKPGTENPNPPSPAGDQADGEADRITTIEDLAARQDRTDSKVDGLTSRIDQVLAGGKHAEGQAHAAAQDRVEHKLSDPGHLDEIKAAIRDVNAEAADAEARSAHDAEHERLRQGTQAAEQAPREAVVRGKQRLQRWIFGGDQ
jgi:uncharacterized protein YukE